MTIRPAGGACPQSTEQSDPTAREARPTHRHRSRRAVGSQGVASWVAPPAALLVGIFLLLAVFFRSPAPTAEPLTASSIRTARAESGDPRDPDRTQAPRQREARGAQTDERRFRRLEIRAEPVPNPPNAEESADELRRRLRIPDYETTCGLGQAELSAWGTEEASPPRTLRLEPRVDTVAAHGDRTAPRVAIVLDDGGYGGWPTEEILGLDNRLTLSILPFAPYSTATAERAAALGFEIMLHMPMESYYRSHNCTGFLGVAMDQTEIARRIEAALADVPGAVGLNNHTGGRYTRDAAAMARVMTAIRDRNLFFLDSRVVSRSRGYDVACAHGIAALSNMIFLDHCNDMESIRRYFNQLIELARQRGDAIGIGHFRPNTVTVLKQMLPELKAHGIELVHASALLRQDTPAPCRPVPCDLSLIAERIEGGAGAMPAPASAEAPVRLETASVGAG